jgi:WD40 repeat protein
MEYGRGEHHLNIDEHLPHHQRAYSDHVDMSDSPLLPIQHYLGLGAIPPLVEDQLAPALQHLEWKTRVQAIRQLERSRKQDALAAFLTALEDEHPAVRAAAAHALGTYPTLQDILSSEPLITALHDPSWHVRAEVVLALGKYREQAPVDLLIAALEDEDETVRATAASALGQLGERVPIECLVKALYDPIWTVREAAAYALSEQGTRVPITPLLLTRNDKDRAVQDAVEWAIQQTHPEMITTTAFNTIHAVSDLAQPNISTKTMLSSEALTDEIPAEAGMQNDADFSPKHAPAPSQQQAPARALVTTGHVQSLRTPTRLSTRSSRRNSFIHILERGIAAAVVIGIALSWFLLNRGMIGSNTGSLWNVSLALKQQAPTGSAYTNVAWLTTDRQNISIVTAIDTRGHTHLWDTRSGETVEVATSFQHVVAFTRVANNLLVAYTKPGDSMLQLDRVVVTTATLDAQVETIMQLAGPAKAPSLASWSPDGKHIAVTWGSNKQGSKAESTEPVQVWDIARQKSISILPACSTTLDKNGQLEQKPGSIKALAWTDDNKEISTACTSNDNDHMIETWNASTGQPIKALHNQLVQYRPVSVAGEVTALAWSPDDNYLAYLLTDGEVHILPQKSDQMSDIWLNYGYSNQSKIFSGVLSWSANSKYLAATTTAINPVGTITGWDTTGNQLYSYSGHSQPIYGIAWSSNDKSIASVSKDGTLQIWNTSP